MNIAQEKQYVYDMMREITIERRQLTDIYFQLKKRLEELDELDKTKALNKLMTKLNEAENSIHEYGTISADNLEVELGI